MPRQRHGKQFDKKNEKRLRKSPKRSVTVRKTVYEKRMGTVRYDTVLYDTIRARCKIRTPYCIFLQKVLKQLFWGSTYHYFSLKPNGIKIAKFYLSYSFFVKSILLKNLATLFKSKLLEYLF